MCIKESNFIAKMAQNCQIWIRSVPRGMNPYTPSRAAWLLKDRSFFEVAQKCNPRRVHCGNHMNKLNFIGHIQNSHTGNFSVESKTFSFSALSHFRSPRMSKRLVIFEPYNLPPRIYLCQAFILWFHYPFIAQCTLWAVRWLSSILAIAVKTLSHGKTIFLRLFFLCCFRKKFKTCFGFHFLALETLALEHSKTVKMTRKSKI